MQYRLPLKKVADPVGRAADGLRRIVQALRTSSHAIEKKLGVSGAQVFVLQELSLSGGLSLRALAQRTRTDPSSVSVAVSRLEAQGLLRREQAKEDAGVGPASSGSRAKERSSWREHPSRRKRVSFVRSNSSAPRPTSPHSPPCSRASPGSWGERAELRRCSSKMRYRPLAKKSQPRRSPSRGEGAVPGHEVFKASTTEGLPVAPSMSAPLALSHVERHDVGLTSRVAWVSGVAVFVAFLAAAVAQVLTRLIALITNLAFYGRFEASMASPAGNHLGAWVVIVPVVGGLFVGLMARYGSPAIRGHGIPEAMEQVLHNESRIPARMAFLKPISAAIAIGTGGPFGAEGPIIATGGALGSLFGQVLKITADERKVLLGAGAAAGMAATFGSPVSAVLLAIELLVFEYRARSFVPIALAAVTGAAVRRGWVGSASAFVVPALGEPSALGILGYVVLGAVFGVMSVFVTRAVYVIEDWFEKLPIHWMWWPVLGAIPVGVVGYFAPRTMGVGYDNIEQIVGGALGVREVALLCGLKFVSWSIALGSGTSGGTLAPLFTVGGGLGALGGVAVSAVLPSLGVDPRMAALVGMAALFAGASRAMLASVVFALETTHQISAVLPLLGGCVAAYLSSSLMMRNSIMTEKMARRGRPVPTEYGVDFLEQVLVRDVLSTPAVTLDAAMTVETTLAWLSSGAPGAQHQGFPVVGPSGALIGVVTRRELLAPSVLATQTVGELVTRPPVYVFEDSTLRHVADRMAEEHIGRVPVVGRSSPQRPLGVISRSDLISAHKKRLTRGKVASRSRTRPMTQKRAT